MASKPSVSKNTGIMSLLFVISLSVLAYTFYLEQTNQALDVQAGALTPSFLFLNPGFVKKIIVAGNFAGTLAAVLINVVNALLYASFAFVAYYLALRNDEEPATNPTENPKNTVNKTDAGENTAEIKGSEIMVMLPKYKNFSTGEMMGGAIDRNPYRQVFYRIQKKLMQAGEGVELSPINRLYIAIYSMLEAHLDVPASVGTHHADASLRDHSLAVSKLVVQHYRDQGKQEPLAAVAGLAHDLDKLLGYQKKGDTWGKNVNATHHNKFAAYIVSTQPEFHELTENDRNTLLLALRYYHDPLDLPLGANGRIEDLIRALRVSDGYSIKDEKAAGVISAATDEASIEVIDKALLATLSELNINAYLNNNEHAGGWTAPVLEYVLTPLSTVLESIGKHLTPKLVRQLQLDHETRTFNHPAAVLIRERLTHMSLLMTSYKNLKSETGMYECRIGIHRFSAILMLEKTKLEALIPGSLEKWGKAPYGIRITAATVDKSKQEENDVSD